jgi:hypothetical protein
VNQSKELERESKQHSESYSTFERKVELNLRMNKKKKNNGKGLYDRVQVWGTNIVS